MEFNSFFYNKEKLIDFIHSQGDLKHFFRNGACSQLTKLLYLEYTDKRKEKLHILGFVKRDQNEKRKNGITKDDGNIIKKHELDHVGIVISGEFIDSTTRIMLDEDFDHEFFNKENFDYYLIELKKKSQSVDILEDIILSHKHSYLTQEEIKKRILHAVINR